MAKFILRGSFAAIHQSARVYYTSIFVYVLLLILFLLYLYCENKWPIKSFCLVNRIYAKPSNGMVFQSISQIPIAYIYNSTKYLKYILKKKTYFFLHQEKICTNYKHSVYIDHIYKDSINLKPIFFCFEVRVRAAQLIWRTSSSASSSSSSSFVVSHCCANVILKCASNVVYYYIIIIAHIEDDVEYAMLLRCAILQYKV